MSTIKIPDDFDFNINYLQLFNYFTCLKVPLIPIALYRTKHAFDNFEPYVYTNPIGLSPIMVVIFYIKQCVLTLLQLNVLIYI